jgi:hypothetical protein
MVLRLSVPAAGGLRVVAGDLAVKMAEHLSAAAPDAERMGDALEELANRVAPPGLEADIGFEFRSSGSELLIRADCKGQTSELRYPLPG